MPQRALHAGSFRSHSMQDQKIETTKWLNLLHHIRRIEWSYIFNDCDYSKVLLREKFKVAKLKDLLLKDSY